MVTHDPHAAAVADRLVLIRDGLLESTTSRLDVRELEERVVSSQ
jgi:ABC-type lipoprotein export system ATPase subunit